MGPPRTVCRSIGWPGPIATTSAVSLGARWLIPRCGRCDRVEKLSRRTPQLTELVLKGALCRLAPSAGEDGEEEVLPLVLLLEVAAPEEAASVVAAQRSGPVRGATVCGGEEHHDDERRERDRDQDPAGYVTSRIRPQRHDPPGPHRYRRRFGAPSDGGVDGLLLFRRTPATRARMRPWFCGRVQAPSRLARMSLILR
jgi:hypothetical protein